MEHFLTVFKNFGRISGISMAFFTKPEKSLPLVKKFNGQIKAHVYENCRYLIFATYLSAHSAQSCDLTNFSILGDFAQKMADISDFKKDLTISV